MVPPNAPELLHLIGYLTGAILYAMLLAMVVRTQPHRDRLALVTASLGLAWNVGELSAHGLESLGVKALASWFNAASYSALGLLASAVVHSVSRPPSGSEGASRRSLGHVIAAVAYSSAAIALILHLRAAFSGEPLPSAVALVVVTGGLLIVAGPLVRITRRQPNSRRALWMAALAFFAVSALHLGQFHGANESWTTELLGHHASIPLAFAILYEDYRFALADLFLKRAISLIALVALVFGAYALAAPALGTLPATGVGLLLVLWTATAWLFPWLRRGIVWFVDHVVLARVNYGVLVDRLASDIQRCQSTDAVLTRACEALAPALSAETVAWEPRAHPEPGVLSMQEIAVFTTDEPHYVLIIGRLAAGRRLLSDDLAMLERGAVLVARRIDALRLTEERYERMLQEREMRTLATEAELRALRAQVNPHFLFNALTTIGYLIQSAPPRALDTLLRLTTLLRGVLRSDGEFTTLGRERELIECYLQIERERFEERLTATIDIPDTLDSFPIPALIVQPLVENAIKHGIARARAGGSVTVVARRDDSVSPPTLRVIVRNTGAPLGDRRARTEGGVGLHSVERRLQCYYGMAASLHLSSDDRGTTVAELCLPATDADGEDDPLAVTSRRAAR